MKRTYLNVWRISDWKRLLADPDLRWKRGRSALELAVSWELAFLSDHGMPSQLKSLLDQATQLSDARVLFAVPEHQMELAGIGKASCTDLWALLQTQGGLTSLAVEAKAGEPFDVTVEDWLSKAGSDRSQLNRQARLAMVCQTLDLCVENTNPLRYQLLHRTASVLLEAQRCGAKQAVVLVQSFSSGQPIGLADFQAFGTALGAVVEPGHLVKAHPIDVLSLWLGWVDCPLASDQDIARTLC